MSNIRLRKTGILRRPAVSSTTGQLSVSGSGTTLKVAFWTRKLLAVVGPTGDINSTDATGFLPAGTDVERRDQLTVNGRVYEVLQVISADDDRGKVDHIGVQLQDIGREPVGG